jgi:hypothetical protein
MCACIVVGSPALFEPDCQTPKQMKLANTFCRFLEVAGEARIGPQADLRVQPAGSGSIAASR